MYWTEIVMAAFTVVLAFTTLALVFYTAKLHESTKRYAAVSKLHVFFYLVEAMAKHSGAPNVSDIIYGESKDFYDRVKKEYRETLESIFD